MQKKITVVIVFYEKKLDIVFKYLEKIKNFKIIIVNTTETTLFSNNINETIFKI